MRVAIAAILLATSVAAADDGPPPANDGYCDFVEGAASATAATQLAPEVFGQIGYIEQAASSVNPDAVSSGGRVIAGVKWSVSNVFVGLATRDRAVADCSRHRALELVRGETLFHALDAKVKVLDQALAETDKILADTDADLQARRTTAQEATATKLRVEELRGLAVEAHRQMSALPAYGGQLGGALKAFQTADAEVEHQEGKLRFLSAFDVSIRFGVDEFFDRTTNPSPYFAVLSVGVNLGALWLGGGNDRAARGRKRYTASGHDPLAVDATAERLQAVAAVEAKRAAETAALEADLQHQLDTLAKIGGEDGRKYRQTVWFDLVKVRAEHVYLQAHLESIKAVLGDVP